MMKKYILTLIILFVLCNGNSANARLTLVEPLPACVTKYIKNHVPYGVATLNKLFFHVYDATFWSDGQGWDFDSTNALHLKYFVDIDGKDFVERTLEELTNNPVVNGVMLEDFKRILPPLLPSVKEGDSISAIYVPKTGLFFCHNNKSTGILRNSKMEQAFMEIWLGKHTSEPEMRKKLLRL